VIVGGERDELLSRKEGCIDDQLNSSRSRTAHVFAARRDWPQSGSRSKCRDTNAVLGQYCQEHQIYTAQFHTKEPIRTIRVKGFGVSRVRECCVLQAIHEQILSLDWIIAAHTNGYTSGSRRVARCPRACCAVLAARGSVNSFSDDAWAVGVHICRVGVERST
jgi:hypothetical protein